MQFFNTSYPLLLNADVGEGFDYDEAIIQIVDIANIACGAHAGDNATIDRTLNIVRQYNKYAFAHVGYDDKANFGRESVQMSKQALTDCVNRQLDSFFSIAAQRNTPVYGIKLHGALYHDASNNHLLGNQLIELCQAYRSRFHEGQLVITAQAHSSFLQACKNAGITTLAEAFVDRRYDPDKRLLSRDISGAVIEDTQSASDQAYSLCNRQSAVSLDGKSIAIKADTLCLHGDSGAALNIAQAVAIRLRRDGDKI